MVLDKQQSLLRLRQGNLSKDINKNKSNKIKFFQILTNMTDIGFSEDEWAMLEKDLDYIPGRLSVSNDFKFVMAAVSVCSATGVKIL